MTDMDLDTVKCEVVEDHIAIVKLDNPPVNAHSPQMLADIPTMFDRLSDLDQDPGRGPDRAGESVLCGRRHQGAMPVRSRQPGDHWRSSRSAREAYHSIRECQKPVVAAINGAALGGGLAIAASCDILISSELGNLGLPEIDVGLMGGQRHAMRLFSHSRLRTMSLTGQRILRARALPHGCRRGVRPARGTYRGGVDDRPVAGVEEPGGHAHRQGLAQRHRGDEPARWLSAMSRT